MKKMFLIAILCLSIMVWFPINGWASRECCCNITCDYGLAGNVKTISVNKCYPEDTFPICNRDAACLVEKGLWDIYTGGGSGSCSWQTDDWCSLAYLYGPDNPQLDTLRLFRDEVLSQSPEGQELIYFYYEWSPVIIQAMEEDEAFKEYVKEMINGILPMMEEEKE